MGWALLLIGLLFAPIVWAFTKGRHVGEMTEDHEGMTAFGNLIRGQGRPEGPTGGGGVSGGAIS